MVTGGNHHSIALTISGDSVVWGRLDGYQTDIEVKSLPLHDETQVMKSDSGRPCVLIQPTRVPNVPLSRYVAAGSDHSLVVTRDGKVYSWGFNSSHQCGQAKDKEENGNDGLDDDEDDLDEIKEAILIGSRVIGEKTIIRAGAGGQFSAIAVKTK